MLTDKQELKSYIKFDRLIYLPIKLIAAYLIYANFDYGAFFIMAYILFCLTEQSIRQSINAQEANNDFNELSGLIQQHQNNGFRQNTELSEIKDQLEIIALQMNELEDLMPEIASIWSRKKQIEEI